MFLLSLLSEISLSYQLGIFMGYPAVFSVTSGYAVVNCINVEAKVVFTRAFMVLLMEQVCD